MKKNKEYDSNKSRREFIKLLGLATTGLSLGLFHLGCESRTKFKRLMFYGTGTLDIQDWTKLKSDLGIDVSFHDNGNDPGPVLTKMITGTAATDYDIGGLQGGAERELAEANKILPWDLKRIPNWESLWEWAKDVPYAKVNGKQYGLPVVVNADSIIYLPDQIKQAIPESEGIIDSYAAVFDERLKGRTAMEDAWVNSVIFTAIFLKESGQVVINNPGDLEEDELAQVMEFLIRKKEAKQFLTFWQGWEHGLKLITSKQVWAMTGWEPIVFAAVKEGVNAKYAVPKEGFEGWSNDLILHQGVLDKDLYETAHEFANWELDGYYGCMLAKTRGYIVPNDKSVEFARNNPSEFDANMQLSAINNVKDKFLKMKGSIYWQNVRPRNFKLYEKWWSQLRNI